MKKIIVLSMLCASAVMLTGCGVFPTKGTVMAPITLEHVASGPFVDNSVRPLKRGETTSGGIILFGTGDASISTAMRNGGITKVHHVDYSVMNILFLYSEIKTIVYGE
ncbi:MAG: TRL domain-containing protein [Kiritimatiellae bacterium]|nr:TRL domain-containing protein [Kiritimatiellia bacterium]